MNSRPSQHRRFGATALAAVWLAVPLLALLHGSHAHRFCAAHGTFEEAAHAGGVEGDDREPAAVDADAPRVTGAAPEGPVGGHESCPLLSGWQRQGLSGAGPVWVDGVAPMAEPRAVSRPLVAPQVAPLVVAPKGSPPRA